MMKQSENELPRRKHPRLKNYDYSQNGIYFVTISAKDQLPVFSDISAATQDPVGRGLAPADPPTTTQYPVGRGLAPAEINVVLSPIGKIAEEQLFALEKRYPYVTIDKYVIMPTHIHVIFILHDGIAAGASPRPTVNTDEPFKRDGLTDIVCVYKSLTTRLCRQQGLCTTQQLFQASFYEEIIRNREAYAETCNYIAQNPLRWYYKHNA